LRPCGFARIRLCEIIHYFRDIPWNALNKAAKNDYASVVSKVLGNVEDKKEVQKITIEVDSIYHQIGELKLERLTGNKRPPKP
jgi:hypothetical protein